ncbi:MAG: hypothetical protein ACI89X_001144 [Planctomycetota bacterium]|jgi:hypothetical protein
MTAVRALLESVEPRFAIEVVRSVEELVEQDRMDQRE